MAKFWWLSAVKGVLALEGKSTLEHKSAISETESGHSLLIRPKGFINFLIHLVVLVPMLWSLSTTERSMLVTATSVDTFTLSWWGHKHF